VNFKPGIRERAFMGFGDFSDEQNPYAAPQASNRRDEHFGGPLEPVPARVSFDRLEEAWTLLKARAGAWILLAFVATVITTAVAFPLGFAVGMFEEAMKTAGLDQQTHAAMLIFSFIVQQLVGIAINSFWLAGLYRAACKQIRGEEFGVGTLFEGMEVLPSVFAAQLFLTIAVIAGAIFCIVPGLLIATRCMLYPPLIVDGRQNGTAALGASWRALEGQTLIAFAFMLVTGLLSALGLFLCCVGIFFTAPLYTLSVTLMYRDFFLMKSKPPAADSPWMKPI
jgi:hypothetical protein